MACGLPIITTSVSGCKDLIKGGYNGILVQPKDPKQLFNVIHYLLNNTNFANYLGNNARLTAENEYSWDILSKQVESKYKSILDKY